MRLMLITLIFLLLVLDQRSARAAFVIRNISADSAFTSTTTAHGCSSSGDGWSGFEEPRSRLSRVAYVLAMVSLGGACVAGLAAGIGVFAALTPAIISVVFIALGCIGIAGFIVGIIALSRGEPERHLARRAVIWGGVWVLIALGGALAYITRNQY